MGRKSIDIREADVWVPTVWPVRYPFRRVVAIRDDVVVYSDGSDTNHVCRLATFREFARSAQLEYRRDG